jgi:hypothetical protein
MGLTCRTSQFPLRDSFGKALSLPDDRREISPIAPRRTASATTSKGRGFPRSRSRISSQPGSIPHTAPRRDARAEPSQPPRRDRTFQRPRWHVSRRADQGPHRRGPCPISEVPRTRHRAGRSPERTLEGGRQRVPFRTHVVVAPSSPPFSTPRIASISLSPTGASRPVPFTAASSVRRLLSAISASRSRTRLVSPPGSVRRRPWPRAPAVLPPARSEGSPGASRSPVRAR